MIVDVDAKSRQLFISYLYWGDQWNEWVHIESGRIAPFGSQTYQVAGVAACFEKRARGKEGLGGGVCVSVCVCVAAAAAAGGGGRRAKLILRDFCYLIARRRVEFYVSATVLRPLIP